MSIFDRSDSDNWFHIFTVSGSKITARSSNVTSLLVSDDVSLANDEDKFHSFFDLHA